MNPSPSDAIRASREQERQVQPELLELVLRQKVQVQQELPALEPVPKAREAGPERQEQELAQERKAAKPALGQQESP